MPVVPGAGGAARSAQELGDNCTPLWAEFPPHTALAQMQALQPLSWPKLRLLSSTGLRARAPRNNSGLAGFHAMVKIWVI